MDSFNQAGGRGQSSASPATPSTAYQTNVNRTKTRKWVEAKVQNYDGDDWGYSDEDSDRDSIGPEPPLQPTSTQAAKPVAQVPEPAAAAPPASFGAPPSFAQREVESDDRVTQPPIHAAPTTGNATAATTEVAQDDVDDGEDKRASISPQLPNMARMSAFGFDLFPDDSKQDAAKLNAAEPIREESEPSPEPASHSFAAEPKHAGQPAATAPQTAAQLPSHLSPEFRSSEQDISSLSEQDDTAPRDTAPSSSVGSQRIPSNEPSQGLALRIDSPGATAGASRDLQQPNTATTATDTPVSIIPTEPLQPKKPEQSPSDYEPQSLQHVYAHDTATSSPVKESDVLSDEIMRSLTPGSNNGAPGLRPEDSSTSLATGSWERSGASSISGTYQHHEAVAMPMLSISPQQSPAAVPVQPQSPLASPATETDRDLRRRFSWEAPRDEDRTPSAAPVASDVSAVPIQQPPVQSPIHQQPSVQSPVQSPAGPSQADERSPSSAQTGQPMSPISPTIKVVSDSQPLDQQVSITSPVETSPGPSYIQPSIPEVQPAASGSDVLSDAPHSSAGGHEAGGAAGPSSGAERPAMALKDIMALSSPEERLAKYAESRSSFATSDSGLEEWITTMKNQHPEYAHASGSYSGAMPTGGPARTPSPSGSQPSTQQPYYQQYLNASNPNQSTPSSARSRLAGFQEQASAAAGSAFGHSGNQIGHKGKEFMQSAGKMGKGLFSKGKSKLRGTGDKVFH